MIYSIIDQAKKLIDKKNIIRYYIYVTQTKPNGEKIMKARFYLEDGSVLEKDNYYAPGGAWILWKSFSHGITVTYEEAKVVARDKGFCACNMETAPCGFHAMMHHCL